MSEQEYKRFELGEYIVADSRICHGQPTFKGTQKVVEAILNEFEDGKTIDEIAKEYDIPKAAIAEGLKIASETLLQQYRVPHPPIKSALEIEEEIRREKAGEIIEEEDRINYPRVELGRYLVSDPYICHGKPTFKGTRVMVHLVIEDFEYWHLNELAYEYPGVSREALVEALRLAATIFGKIHSVSYFPPIPPSRESIEEAKNVKIAESCGGQ